MRKEHVIVTIIAPNYLSQALVLGSSLAHKMPEVSFRILILQDNPHCSTMEYIVSSEEYLQGRSIDHDLLNLQSIDWEEFDIPGAVNKYDLLEFATAVKPALIRSLLKDDWKRVTYLDPDIQVFEDFSTLLSSESAIHLTPHILEDFPSDGKLPNHQNILYAGTYNLGFISCTQAALGFLDWWAQKLENFCTMEVQEGYHVDQKWVDWAPSFCDTQILRHPGLNVAYWNLHERELLRLEEKYFIVRNSQLDTFYFFHFSGFNDFQNLHLSRYLTRKFSESAISIEFIQDYADKRMSWHVYLENCSREHEFEVDEWTLGGRRHGAAWPPDLRKKVIAEDRKQLERHPVFIRGSSNNPNSRIRRESLGGLAIGWIIAHEFSRKEIERLASGEIELNLGVNLTDQDLKMGIDDATREMELLPRLKLVGYFAAPTGVGQAARNTAAFLKAAQIDFVVDTVETPFDSDELAIEIHNLYPTPQGKEDCVLAFINADMWLVDGISTGKIDTNRHYVAAVWAWEIKSIPSYFKQVAQYIDRIYALSEFSAQALRENLSLPIGVFPTYCGEKNFPNRVGANREELVEAFPGLPEKYILCRFDAKSILKRKNPELVIKVWKVIHSEFPDFHLVMKTIDLDNLASCELLREIAESPRTIVLDGEVSHDINSTLMSHASVYISLHRAEGLGLNILEAIYADVPAVFTNYSGLAAELGDIGYTVDCEMTEIGEDAHPYPPTGYWAEPSFDSAVSQLTLALESVKSGEWKGKFHIREAWVGKFLDRSSSLILDEVRVLLSSTPEVENRIESFRNERVVVDEELDLKIAIKLFLPLWKILPLNIRTKLKPVVVKMYFLIVKPGSNPTRRR